MRRVLAEEDATAAASRFPLPVVSHQLAWAALCRGCNCMLYCPLYTVVAPQILVWDNKSYI